MKNKKLAICLISHPDVDDIEKYKNGEIDLSEIKIFYKGRKYFVYPFFDNKYFKLLNNTVWTTLKNP